MGKVLNQRELYCPLEELHWDNKYLKDFCNNLDQEGWYEFNCSGLRWTLREDSFSAKRTECTSFERQEFFQELLGIFNLEINYSDILFTRTPPPGIPPHVDRNRSAAINFPVLGNLKDSPMVWYNNFEDKEIVGSCNHFVENRQCAILFDPKKIHGVINNDDFDRCLLSIWWRNIPYKDFLKLYSNGELFNLEKIEASRFFSIKGKCK